MGAATLRERRFGQGAQQRPRMRLSCSTRVALQVARSTGGASAASPHSRLSARLAAAREACASIAVALTALVAATAARNIAATWCRWL